MLNTGMRLEPKEKWNMKAVRATFLGSAEDQRKDLEEVERQRQKIQTPVPDDPLVRGAAVVRLRYTVFRY